MFGRREADSAVTTRLRCMVVFVGIESTKLRLDCVLVESLHASGLNLGRGAPLTVTVDHPATEWAAAALAALDRWAAESCVVDISLVRQSGMTRVRATDGQTRLLLDG